jgi:hypothetical protein
VFVVSGEGSARSGESHSFGEGAHGSQIVLGLGVAALAAMGGAMIVHWAVKEARRINEELEQARRVKVKITDAENRPTLRRDPATGEYRL